MGFNCGIVGLPNVGKSTLFNALTASTVAAAENFPFCTIEPNLSRVAVPDKRLTRIAQIANSAVTTPTNLEFVDIAGLVRGASKGEGLGNQFLENIRAVDAIIHVLRCFDDEDVTHVNNTVDPLRDAETVETELMLADLESLERRAESISKKARIGDEEALAQLSLINPILDGLKDGKPARAIKPADLLSTKYIQNLQLLTAKPVLYVCNVNEAYSDMDTEATASIRKHAEKWGTKSINISAAIEAEVSQLSNVTEREDFLGSLGLTESGLAKVIRTGYGLLDLITFFTAGPKEARAWTVHKGTSAPQAAGQIHTDFERGFIRAETISYTDYVSCNGEQGAKDSGKMRQEGRDYVINDGDVLHFLFNI